MGWRSMDVERAEGWFEVGGAKKVRRGDKGEWLGEGGWKRWGGVGRGGQRNGDARYSGLMLKLVY